MLREMDKKNLFGCKMLKSESVFGIHMILNMHHSYKKERKHDMNLYIFYICIFKHVYGCSDFVAAFKRLNLFSQSII